MHDARTNNKFLEEESGGCYRGKKKEHGELSSTSKLPFSETVKRPRNSGGEIVTYFRWN